MPDNIDLEKEYSVIEIEPEYDPGGISSFPAGSLDWLQINIGSGGQYSNLFDQDWAYQWAYQWAPKNGDEGHQIIRIKIRNKEKAMYFKLAFGLIS